jgi:hypothetical protein
MRTLLRWLFTAVAVGAIVVLGGVFSPTQALAAASLPGSTTTSGPTEAWCATNYYGRCATNYGYGNSYYGNSYYSNPYYGNSRYGNYYNSYYGNYNNRYSGNSYYNNNGCGYGYYGSYGNSYPYRNPYSRYGNSYTYR